MAAVRKVWTNNVAARPVVVDMSVNPPVAGEYLLAWFINDSVGDNPTWNGGFVAVTQVSINNPPGNSQDLFVGAKISDGTETSLSFQDDSSFSICHGGVLAINGNTATQPDCTAGTGVTETPSVSQPWTQDVRIEPVTDSSLLIAILGSDITPPGSTNYTVTMTASDTAGSSWTTKANLDDFTSDASRFLHSGVAVAVQTFPGRNTVTTSGSSSPSKTSGSGVVVVAVRSILPTISVGPQDQTVFAGATATFSVTAAASSGGLTYQWQKSTGGAYSDVGGATSSSYTTPATVNGDNGTLYRVKVTDSNGTKTAYATLFVLPLNSEAWWQG